MFQKFENTSTREVLTLRRKSDPYRIIFTLANDFP